YNRRITSEGALPEIVADHYDVFVAGMIFFRGERAAENWLAADGLEKSRGDAGAVNAFGAFGIRDIEKVVTECADCCECAGDFFEHFELGAAPRIQCCARLRAGRICAGDYQGALGLSVG